MPLPFPLPFLREELPAPVIPHEEYGPPAPLPPPPPPIILAPYPAPVTTTTEAPSTTLAYVPPPPPIFEGPYPAPVTTTTEAPTTSPPIRRLPYPAPTTTTEVPSGPYPAFSSSKYESDSGLSSSISGGFVDEVKPVPEHHFEHHSEHHPVIVPAVRTPTKFVKQISFIQPKFVIKKKVIGFPKLGILKKKLFRRFIF